MDAMLSPHPCRRCNSSERNVEIPSTRGERSALKRIGQSSTIPDAFKKGLRMHWKPEYHPIQRGFFAGAPSSHRINPTSAAQDRLARILRPYRKSSVRTKSLVNPVDKLHRIQLISEVRSRSESLGMKLSPSHQTQIPHGTETGHPPLDYFAEDSQRPPLTLHAPTRYRCLRQTGAFK